MVKIPTLQDPTLLALDEALEKAQSFERRQYLGASAIGESCERKLWLNFRWAKKGFIEAAGIRRIEDGHRGEKVLADWLRLIPGVDLSTEKEPGVQHSFEDFGGHFRGNCDGLITGLIQSPKKLHVWECKIVNEQKHKKLYSLKVSKGEDNALREWDPIYYAQAQIYMHYFKAERHYLTAGSPGVRDLVSVRTPYVQADAEKFINKAKRIIFANRPPSKISNDPAWYECKFCSFHGMCHNSELPKDRSCRTCMHSTPTPEGTWKCEKHDHLLTKDMQVKGCGDHLFHPDLVPGEQTDYGEGWVEYTLSDGSKWLDGNN
jgi:hypothetical protein